MYEKRRKVTLLTKKYRAGRKWLKLHPPQVLALGFITLFIAGGFLLWLPVSTTRHISFLDAFFTATSASTITGLNVVDIGSTYTLFGQIVIMCLIQIGGLGFMTFAVFTVMILGRKIGLRQRLLIQEALNQPNVGGIVRLVKVLIIFSLFIELAATVLLSMDWVPKFGLLKGFYYSLFHVVSAFNNAGFSLWPNSLSDYVGDPVVNIIITVLITTGGLGFIVLVDIWYSKQFRDLTLHSKLMITGTLVISVISMLFFFLFEYGNPGTIGGLSLTDKLIASYFQGVSPRTAGFNTIDFSHIHEGTALIIMLQMFIGAGSGSTGSGIKVTTFLVILLAVMSFIRGKDQTVVFNRSIKSSTIMRSIAIVVISLTTVFVAVLILTVTEHASFFTVLFEAVSAFGTAGVTMGLTDHLSTAGRFIIIFLMFLGRVGPLTLAFSLSAPKKSNIRFPSGDVFTG
ncbi:TrkH family potassium uptake protein [Scopulibacillus cellulosilyticus]|uniref:TrkH family potassium uptake protein n=1 Tax=Scopulibacillus cellulosilyticus TaxID=2665665 RepID=A0ABW2PTD2_9BACL